MGSRDFNLFLKYYIIGIKYLYINYSSLYRRYCTFIILTTLCYVYINWDINIIILNNFNYPLI